MPLPSAASARNSAVFRVSRPKNFGKLSVATDNRKQNFAREAVPHFKDLYRAAVRPAREPSKAEDIVQEVYLQAWKSFAAFESDANCRAWLYKIMFADLQNYVFRNQPVIAAPRRCI